MNENLIMSQGISYPLQRVCVRESDELLPSSEILPAYLIRATDNQRVDVESFSHSINVEINYEYKEPTDPNRPTGYVLGKRVCVGSMVLPLASCENPLLTGDQTSVTDIPIADYVLIAKNIWGETLSRTLYGVVMTQETSGWSSYDLGNQLGISFCALAISKWVKIKDEKSE